jgi:hypothetical protein
LAYLDEQVVGRSLSAAAEVGRMLNGLTQAIKRKCSAPSDP